MYNRVVAKGGVLDPQRIAMRQQHQRNPHSSRRPQKMVACEIDKWLYEVPSWDPTKHPREPRPYALFLDGVTRQIKKTLAAVANEVAFMVGNFVERAVENFGFQSPLFRRACHLLALPLLATGFGGMRQRSDLMVRALLPILREKAALHGVDIAIVCYERDAWLAAQRERFRCYNEATNSGNDVVGRERFGLLRIGANHLDNRQIHEARKLGELAVTGKLALFVGAGVSCGAGCPTWGGLMWDIGTNVAGLSEDEMNDLRSLSFLDQATILEKRIQAKSTGVAVGTLALSAEHDGKLDGVNPPDKLFGERSSRDNVDVVVGVAGCPGDGDVDKPKTSRTTCDHLSQAVARRILRCTRYSMAHSLLTSLPVHEIITTNYDTLLQDAWTATRDRTKVSVLPHSPVQESSKWLLHLHGSVKHPEDIVLTRKSYIRYTMRNAALGGMVHSTMMTKHLLYLGFSLTDDNFHKM